MKESAPSQGLIATGGSANPIGPASGDLAGTYPGPTVAQITAGNPASDIGTQLGTSALRYASVATGNVGLRTFGAASDANPTTTIGGAKIAMGNGGASALDVAVYRSAANVVTLDNNAGSATQVLGLATGSVYHELLDGASAAVSGASTGRIRYNNTTGTFQASTKAGGYTSLGGAALGVVYAVKAGYALP